jgi:hypothetical protein
MQTDRTIEIIQYGQHRENSLENKKSRASGTCDTIANNLTL